MKCGNILRIRRAALSTLSFIFIASLHGETQIEEKVVGPTGSEIKYALAPHALHLAAAALQGSRRVILVDNVAGPKFDELVWVKGRKFEHFNELVHSDSKDSPMNDSEAPIVFSEDGSRYAYVGRQGSEFVIILDGKEFARGPYAPAAVQSLGFAPGSQRLCYIETGAGTRLVVEGDKNPPAAVRADEVNFSPDGRHYAYLLEKDRRRHLVLDGNIDPPQYAVRGLVLAAGNWRPTFTGDSKHLITAWTQVARQNTEFDQSASTFFVDQKAVLETPLIPESSGQTEKRKFPAVIMRVSAAPAGTSFLAVFRKQDNTRLVYFNDQQIAAVMDVDGIAWSADGEHYAVQCMSAQKTGVMIIDGKRQLEYHHPTLMGNPTSWSAMGAFTADSSKSVFRAYSDKTFVVVNGEESDGFDRIENRDLLFSKTGAHVAFIGKNGEQKTVVIDGRALEPRAEANSLKLSPDGTHYSFLCSASRKGAKINIDGTVQPNTYADDFVPFDDKRPDYENHQCLFSKDGKHNVYLTGEVDGTKRGLCLDGKVFSCKGGHSEVTPFFTPDGRHLVWIEWDNYDRPTGYSIFVDGKEAGHFECPAIPSNIGTVGRVFEHSVNASEMGADGILTLIAPAGDTIKKLRIIPSADTNI